MNQINRFFDTKLRRLYHALPMVAPTNQHLIINNIEFAQRALATHGTIPVLQFSRLADLLDERSGQVSWRLHGGVDAGGSAYLQLQAEAALTLTCQRCLQAMAYPLTVDTRYLLVRHEAELSPLEEERDGEDYLLFQAEMDVLELVEDELLLAMPMAPKHKDVRCAETGSTGIKLDEYRKSNPFASLAALKSGK